MIFIFFKESLQWKPRLWKKKEARKKTHDRNIVENMVLKKIKGRKGERYFKFSRWLLLRSVAVVHQTFPVEKKLKWRERSLFFLRWNIQETQFEDLCFFSNNRESCLIRRHEFRIFNRRRELYKRENVSKITRGLPDQKLKKKKTVSLATWWLLTTPSCLVFGYKCTACYLCTLREGVINVLDERDLLTDSSLLVAFFSTKKKKQTRRKTHSKRLVCDVLFIYSTFSTFSHRVRKFTICVYHTI